MMIGKGLAAAGSGSLRLAPRLLGRELEFVGRSAAMRTQRGFTLVELLVVVAILGILSSIAVANLANALDKGKQKRSMSDLHSIAEAIEAYHIDHAAYPAGVSDWPTLQGQISPFFIKAPPQWDGWSHIWEVATSGGGTDYTVVSLGKDGYPDSRAGGMTSDFNCDIVFSGGQFFQWPQGTQS
jgi:general secretion pathway protein G